jgi:octaprenyl-diphosphate synthase
MLSFAPRGGSKSVAHQPFMAQPPALARIDEEMRRVDALIVERLDSDVALVRKVADYIVSSGGKRLRPALLLLAAGAAGYRGEARFELAAVIEFIHTATLLHDDVVDESELRRGRETANAAFGNAASVLVGDFLYSRAFQMMVGVGSMRVMRILADATNTIAEGEVMQLINCHDPAVDEARYLEVIRRKTAKLFEAAARLGGVLGEVPMPLEDGLAQYGMHLGTSFQLIDDVLDYSGDEQLIGKSLGDDLAEGKPTLPLIRAMRAGTPEQADLVRHAIMRGGRDDFPRVLEVIKSCRALEYARKVATSEADAACRALEPLPRSIDKDSLLELAAFSATRSN